MTKKYQDSLRNKKKQKNFDICATFLFLIEITVNLLLKFQKKSFTEIYNTKYFYFFLGLVKQYF